MATPPRRRVFGQPVVKPRASVQVSPAGVGAPSQGVSRAVHGSINDFAALAAKQINDSEELQVLNLSNQVDELKSGIELEALNTKGRNSFNSSDVAQKDFEEGMADIEKDAFTKRQKKAIGQIRAKSEIQIRKTTERHTLVESEKVRSRDFSAKSKNIMESSLLNWNQPDRVAQNTVDFLDMSLIEAERQGFEGETLETFMFDRMSAYHKVVFDKYIEQKENVMARDYLEFFDDNQGHINASVVSVMEESLKESDFRLESQIKTDAIVNTPTSWSDRFAEAKKIKDPEMREQVTNQLIKERNLQNSLDQEAANDQHIDSINAIEDVVAQTGQGTTARQAVGEKVWNGLTGQQRRNLESYAQLIDPSNQKNPQKIRQRDALNTKAYNEIHRMWLYDKEEFAKQTGITKDGDGNFIAGSHNLETLRPILGEKFYNEFKSNQEKYFGSMDADFKRGKNDLVQEMTDDALKRFDLIFNVSTISESADTFAFTFGFGESDEQEDLNAELQLMKARRSLTRAIDSAIDLIPKEKRTDKKAITEAIDSALLETDVSVTEVFPSASGVAEDANLPRFMASQALKADLIDKDDFTFTDDVRRRLRDVHHIPGSAPFDASKTFPTSGEQGAFLIKGDELSIFLKKRGHKNKDPRTGETITAVWVSASGRIIESSIEAVE